MIKTLLVEDESPAMRILENFIFKFPECELVGKCTSAKEAMEILSTKSVDLMLLDIQMPEVSGIELLQQLPQKPVTIITTANHDMALDAFNLDVVDYLVKPFSFDRFSHAIEKARTFLLNKKKEGETAKPSFIMVKSDYKIVKIHFSEIKFIEGLGEYVKIKLEKNYVVTLEALKNLEKTLPKEDFIRVHKSYIVNTNCIRTISGNNVCLHDGTNIPVGKVYKDEVRTKLKIQ